jgi:hypothetical protein
MISAHAPAKTPQTLSIMFQLPELAYFVDTAFTHRQRSVYWKKSPRALTDRIPRQVMLSQLAST